MSIEMHLNNSLNFIEGSLNLFNFIPLKYLYSNTNFILGDYKGKTLREYYGQVLIISSVAFTALTFLASFIVKDKQTYFNDLSTKGLSYIGHGLLNLVRDQLEKNQWNTITLSYDIYNQKILPYTDIIPKYDIQKRIFVLTKQIFDKINISGIIPTLLK